jgi:hypothetical protein
MMPTKFKSSQINYDRYTKSASTQHFYIKNQSKKELIEYINSNNAKPKIVQKCMNELTRRGIQTIWE